ncbi:DUF6612 family protein [Paenisporosarcina sp. OV554]|uniref:DUF6612 family protein n=1 Tax=Paenisporosarcina sp. OV554 TaxID=2135694 RepID=UPI000D35FDEE|nr:DUF6612 family protein [Paenisporosarcina sp. OV554]PUB14572.1 hypothetical protein C8K15_105132 [Paenisporosarcina sp. OV554]
MKKWKMLMVASVLTLGLAGCNTTATPTSETAKDKKSELTLKQVFDKSLAQSESIKSLNADVEMSQSIEVPSQNVEMNTVTNMNMDMFVEPLSIYQKGTTSTLVPGEDSSVQPQEVEIESYMTDKGFFMNHSMSAQWVKLPEDMYEQMMSMSQKQADPSQQLKDLEVFKDDFSFEQTEDMYVLKLSASGDKFNELIKKQVTETIPAVKLDQENMLKDMNIEKVDYEIFIDKKTFNTSAFNMDLKMSVSVEGEEMKMSQDLKSTFNKFNEIEPITVPQEVLDNAKEM